MNCPDCEIPDPEHQMRCRLRGNPLYPILLDLIAELVGDDGDGHELTGDDEDGCQVCAAIDRAEARLREVTDE